MQIILNFKRSYTNYFDFYILKCRSIKKFDVGYLIKYFYIYNHKLKTVFIDRSSIHAVENNFGKKSKFYNFSVIYNHSYEGC